MRKPTPLNLPADLDDAITATATELRLSKQDTMRLSIERGLPVLLRALQPDRITSSDDLQSIASTEPITQLECTPSSQP